MRKFLVLLPLLVLPVSALAQQTQTPSIEVFGGYSNLTANFSATNFILNGYNVSAQENRNSWFGGALDFSEHFGTDNGFKVNTESISYGPVFSYRKSRVITPFAHGLLGAVRGGPEYLNISKSEIRFGAYVGGGLDVNVGHGLALRLIQADYMYTHFSDFRQNNLRLSAGLVLLLGKKKK